MKKKILIISVIILLIVLVALLTGRVLAKYISTPKASGEAEIAKWSFQSNLKNNGKAVTNSKIQLQNTYQKTTLTNGKIAPGTSGDFTIEIDGTGSDVAIAYTVEFKEQTGKEGKPTNLEFSLDEGKTYVKSIHTLESNMHDTIAANADNKIKTFHVLWRWPYEIKEDETSDATDTKEAAKLTNYAFDIIITGKQVEPI